MNISKLSQQLQTLANETGSAEARTNTTPNAAEDKLTSVSARSEIRLSPLSEKLKALSSEFSTSASVDTDKVNALKTAIANGTFKVNADAVADKMITEAGELFGKKI
jgi:negative regulator of flagellin synthesis FlgM